MRRIRDRKRDPAGEPDKWEVALDDANIPGRFRRAAVEVIDPQRAPAVRRWIEWAISTAPEWMAAGRGWYLEGPFNSGKSSVAALLAMEAVLRCERVLWLPVRDVPAVRFREDDRGKSLNGKLHAADFLVLDDLGSERFRIEGAAGVALEEVIRIMYERERPVVITSNLSWSDFPSAYERNPALVSVVRRCVAPVPILNKQWPEALA